MSINTLLSLDLGTQMGWALRNQYNAIQSGTVSFKNGRYEGGGMRFVRFTAWLDEMLNSCHNIDVVYFEEVRRHTNTDAAHVYGGFLGALSAWCEAKEIPYQGIPVGTIKKHVTGMGNANKEAVIEAVKTRGHMPQDDNEADAIALLYYGIEQIGRDYGSGSAA